VDLGLAGRSAIVCASSRGLGRACAAALAAEGVSVVINGRSLGSLRTTEQRLRASGANVTSVLGDVTTAEGQAALVAACAEPDILINNNAGPTPRPFADTRREDWLTALDSNLLPALALIEAVLPGMRSRGFGRIVNITSAMVTAPNPAMGVSSGPRAALTAICKGLSREVSADGVTINNMLPERFDTDRQRAMVERDMARLGISAAQARANIVDSIPAGRMGRPEEFGATCAFVCSTYAAFMTGTNIHLDGGAYRGLV
jgi:3-oxoacyl-[acyl-carrier protein] reductase